MNIDTTHASPPLVSRWWILFLVHMSMLVYALNLQMIPPLLPTLITKLGLTHTQAGTLMALFTLPGIFLAIPGGRVSDTIGPRGVALWSLALLGTKGWHDQPKRAAIISFGAAGRGADLVRIGHTRPAEFHYHNAHDCFLLAAGL